MVDLAISRHAGKGQGEPPAIADLCLGHHAGTLGEAMPLAIIVGGVVLVALKAIDWRIPLCYLATLSLLALLLPPGSRMAGHAPWLAGNPLVHLCILYAN